MNEVKFNSQICTSVEQSKRLLKLRLNPETADMCWFNDMEKPCCASYKHFVDRAQDMKWTIYPAWSLHRLMMLGNLVNIGIPIIENAYDACIRLIEEQIRFGMFNEEYLNQ